MPGFHIAGRIQSGSATLKFAVCLPCIYQKSHAISIYPRQIKHVCLNAGTHNYKKEHTQVNICPWLNQDATIRRYWVNCPHICGHIELG